jgi:hypothetical protein
LESDWFINQDADEFRESPWLHLDLLQGIRQVDALGYNAIDFEVLNFWPTHDRFRSRDDVREAFRFYEPGGPFDRLQIRCWKKLRAPFDLVTSGGHEVVFEGRKVFPLRFLLRHYPIRSQAHGERKVFAERRPRFDPPSARGWRTGRQDRRRNPFIREESDLRAYGQEACAWGLRHQGVEELEGEPGPAPDPRPRGGCSHRSATQVGPGSKQLSKNREAPGWGAAGAGPGPEVAPGPKPISGKQRRIGCGRLPGGPESSSPRSGSRAELSAPRGP